MRWGFSRGWVAFALVYLVVIGVLSVSALTGDSLTIYRAVLIATTPASFVLLVPIYLSMALVDPGVDGSAATVAVGTLGFMAAAALNVAALRMVCLLIRRCSARTPSAPCLVRG